MTALAANVFSATFSIEGSTSKFRVVAIQGSEAISRPFQFDLELAAPNASLDLGALIDRPARLTLKGPEGTRQVHGIVERLAQGASSGRTTTYFARLVPKLSRLAHRGNARIFQEMPVPEVIQAVLLDAGFGPDEFRFDLPGGVEPQNLCVQYRESDLDFISRLAEDQGLAHTFDPEAGRIVFGDGVSGQIPPSGSTNVAAQYRPGTGASTQKELVTSFDFGEELRAGRSVLRDFDFESPAAPLQAEAEADRFQDLEIFDYPGAFRDTASGEARAQRRLDTAQALAEQGMGASTSPRLVAGSVLSLSKHPRAKFNGDYLVVEVVHRVSSETTGTGAAAKPGYANSFVAIPAETLFRPWRSTPRPVIAGAQTAIIVGPPGEEIHTDEHGRVKVRFHWDRFGGGDDAAAWVRVSQYWAGANWGALHLPRVGQEVIVQFLEGDPRQPVIVGRLYNGANRPPESLPAGKARSGIKSSSTPGGGGANELRFDDTAGSEEIILHAQSDLQVEAEEDKTETIGNDETISIGANRTVTIGANQTLNVGANQSETVAAAKTVNIGSTLTETVGATAAETIGASKELTVGGAYRVTVGALMTEQVVGAKVEQIGANRSVTVGGDLSLTVAKDAAVEVAKSYALKARTVSIEAEDELVLKAGKAAITLKKNGDITISGRNITIKGSGDVAIKGKRILQN